MMKKGLSLLATLSVFATLACAQQSDLDQVATNIKAANARFADASVVVLRELSDEKLPDLYEARLDGQSIIVTKDGTRAIIGELFDLKNMLNLTRIEKQKGQVALVEQEIARLTEADFVTYPAKTELVGQLYIFSDTTCGYCRKLHLEVEDYQNAGIEVKYIPYPRSELVAGEPAFEYMKQVMCAVDKAKAMTEIKAGTDDGKYVRENYAASCIESIRKGRVAGENVGLEGTPFMYLSKGGMQIIPGYQPSSTIISIFNQ